MCQTGWWPIAANASDAFRQKIWDMGARPAIPAKSTDAPVACPSWIYNNRNLVERLWARLKEWRAVAAYITDAPDIALPGAVEAVHALIQRAGQEGVHRLVLLTGRREPEAQRAEAELMASDAAWTIIRASWFMQNFSESVFRYGVAAGEVLFANGHVPEPFIDADDIADVAVAALLDHSHIGQILKSRAPAC